MVTMWNRSESKLVSTAVTTRRASVPCVGRFRLRRSRRGLTTSSHSSAHVAIASLAVSTANQAQISVGIVVSDRFVACRLYHPARPRLMPPPASERPTITSGTTRQVRSEAIQMRKPRNIFRVKHETPMSAIRQGKAQLSWRMWNRLP
jgi:hypothetical protein